VVQGQGRLEQLVHLHIPLFGLGVIQLSLILSDKNSIQQIGQEEQDAK